MGEDIPDMSLGAKRVTKTRRIIPCLQWVDSVITAEVSVVGQQHIIYKTS